MGWEGARAGLGRERLLRCRLRICAGPSEDAGAADLAIKFQWSWLLLLVRVLIGSKPHYPQLFCPNFWPIQSEPVCARGSPGSYVRAWVGWHVCVFNLFSFLFSFISFQIKYIYIYQSISLLIFIPPLPCQLMGSHPRLHVLFSCCSD